MPRRPFTAKELALLDQIHADPRNDALRLAYADWLAQRNDPFGEFIRITINRRELEDGRGTGSEPADLQPIVNAWNDLAGRYGRRHFARPLPDVLAFRHGYDRGGLPTVVLAFPTFSKMDQAWKDGSPRHSIILRLDPGSHDELPTLLEHPLMTRTHEIAIMSSRWAGAGYVPSVYEALSKAIAGCPYLGRMYCITVREAPRNSAEAFRTILAPALGPFTELQF